MQKLYNEENVRAIADTIRENAGYEEYNLININNADNQYSIDGDKISTTADVYRKGWLWIDTIFLKKGIYTISWEKWELTTNNRAIRILNADTNESIYTAYTLPSTRTQYTFTLTNDSNIKFALMINRNENQDTSTITKLQLQEGSTAKPYEPYCQYKLREMPEAINGMVEKREDILKEYIPKTTTEERQFKAIPLSMKQKVYGKVEQETRQGYNKYNKYGDFNYPTTGYVNRTVLLSDGTIKTTANYSSNASRGIRIENIKQNTTYTISGKLISSNGDIPTRIAVARVTGYTDTWSAIYQVLLNTTGVFKGTFNTGECTDLFVSLNSNGSIGSSCEAIYDEIMVYEGTDDKPYEPYGVMPSPEFPSEVKTLKCVNLFDVNKHSDGLINPKTGTNWSSDLYYTSDYIKVNKNSTYILSQKSDITSNPIFIDYCVFFDGNKQYVKQQGVNRIGNTGNFVASDNGYIKFSYYRDETKATDIQITEGTEPQPYTPYGYIRENITGRNLAYDGWAEDFVKRINYNPYARLETFENRNCLRWLASAGYQQYDTKYMFKTKWKQNTQYTFKFDMFPESANSNLAIDYTDGTSKIFGTSFTPGQWTNLLFTSAANKTIKYIRASYSSLVTYIDLDTFMVYEGTDDIPYEPYKSKSTLIYIGDNELLTEDNVEVDEKGNTKMNKEWGKVVLDGSEDGWYDGGGNAPYKKKLNDIIALDGAKHFICNYYISVSWNDVWSNYNYMVSIGTAKVLSFRNIDINSLSEFKAWLSQHPVTVYYQLETPTTTDLGKHDKIVPLEGINNIDVEATLEPSKIESTHYFDYNDIQSAMLEAEIEL